MKYVNGAPEGRKPIVLYKPKRKHDKQMRDVLALDPELKKEVARDKTRRAWEKEMRHPGELEKKREAVNSLRGGPTVRTQPTKGCPQKHHAVREPNDSLLKVLLVNQQTGHQIALWITTNIIYQDILNGSYWMYHELSQRILRAIVSKKTSVEYKQSTYTYKVLKQSKDVDLSHLLVDLKKADATSTKIKIKK